MPIPSKVLASGNSPLATIAISGDGATGLVATGSSITDALQLSAVWNAITTSSASTGVILPPTEVGATIGIRNDSGQTITVYPKSGSTVNAAASSVTLATAKTMILFATSATTWASVTGA
jgi:outer membrane lipoprotein SlyB